VQHKTLNPIEEAISFKKYVEDFGWGGISDLAHKIGRSQEYVSRRVQLLQLPGQVQEKIMRRRISPGVAQELLSIEPEKAEKLAEMIEKKRLKRNEIRLIVKSFKKDGVHELDMEQLPPTYEEVLHLTDGALRKCVTILKSTLVRLDEVVNEIEADWITKEMLMQYRMIIHGDIDAFLKFRKRLESKMRPTYTYISNKKDDDNDYEQSDSSLYQYKGVWQ
jgi:ParB family chromosome partitioning protein